MQKEYYTNFCGCQDAYTQKNLLKTTGYRAVPVSYLELRLEGYTLSLAAYDLYIQLYSMYIQVNRKKFPAYSRSLMFLCNFRRAHAYHAAKNELIEQKLITLTHARAHNTAAIFKVKVKITGAYIVPHAIWHWLSYSMRQKTIKRAARALYLTLYNQFVIQQYSKDVLYSNSSCAVDINVTERTLRNLITSLVKAQYLDVESSKNQYQLSKYRIKLPENIDLPCRDGTPRPVLSLVDSHGRLKEIIKRLQS